MLTLFDFCSGIGAMYSPMMLFFGSVDWMFFFFLSRCPFVVAGVGFKYLTTVSMVMPGHVMKFPLLMALIQIELTRTNIERCKDETISAFDVNCSKLHAKCTPSEIGKYVVSPSEVVNGIFHSPEKFFMGP